MPNKKESLFLSQYIYVCVCAVPFVQINFTQTEKNENKRKEDLKRKILEHCTNMTICTHAKQKKREFESRFNKKKPVTH